MPGVLQNAIAASEAKPREKTEAEWIAVALEMCPPGEAIELHAPFCDVIPCSCVCRRIVKPMVC